ncbi:hypothetical protein AGMMS49573_07820 [Endomicrobiia bacterium]|nr:hypothetical protein AGMMS49573_07820 [Endomicrobiia bacterium]
MVILGIDSGFKNTGVALMDTATNYISTKTIKSDNYRLGENDNKYTIMYSIAYDIIKFITFEKNAYEGIERMPAVVVAENSISRFVGRHISELTETRAVILAMVGHLVISRFNAKTVQINNMSIKKYFFGKDAEHPINSPTKKEMICLMQHRHKIEPAGDKKKEKTEHEYDAIALCDWYVSTH